MHRHLASERLVGEWFRPSGKTMELVRAIEDQGEKNEHVLMGFIYDNDFPAIAWYRVRHLGWASGLSKSKN